MVTKKFILAQILAWLEKNYGGEASDPCYDMESLAGHLSKEIKKLNKIGEQTE